MRVRVMQTISSSYLPDPGQNPPPWPLAKCSLRSKRGHRRPENPYVTIDTSRFFEVQDYIPTPPRLYPVHGAVLQAALRTPIRPKNSRSDGFARCGPRRAAQVSRALSSESLLQRIKDSGLEVTTSPMRTWPRSVPPLPAFTSAVLLPSVSEVVERVTPNWPPSAASNTPNHDRAGLDPALLLAQNTKV